MLTMRNCVVFHRQTNFIIMHHEHMLWWIINSGYSDSVRLGRPHPWDVREKDGTVNGRFLSDADMPREEYEDDELKHGAPFISQEVFSLRKRSRSTSHAPWVDPKLRM